MTAARSIVRLVALGALVAAGVWGAVPPERPVRVIVPFAPGGGTDITARLMAQRLTTAFGQMFVVDNRPGAGSMLGTEIAARATADGYTMLVVSPEFTINPSLQPKVPYDALRDFAPVMRITYGQYILAVRPSVPAKTVKELIAYARSNPRALSYGSSGSGSANHLGGELFKSMAGIDMVHVPFRGSGPSTNAFLAGDVQVLFSSTTAIIGHVRSGRVRALAVTGPKRSAMAPEIPTVDEAGVPGFEVTGWYGMLVPSRVPPAVIQRLNVEANRVLPLLGDRFAELGSEIVGGTPQDFARFLANDVAKWAKVVKTSGARPE